MLDLVYYMLHIAYYILTIISYYILFNKYYISCVMYYTVFCKIVGKFCIRRIFTTSKLSVGVPRAFYSMLNFEWICSKLFLESNLLGIVP